MITEELLKKAEEALDRARVQIDIARRELADPKIDHKKIALAMTRLAHEAQSAEQFYFEAIESDPVE